MSTSLVTGLGGPAGFGENSLAKNDDGSTLFISLSAVFPGGLNYFGNVYNGLWLNNNGSVTFGNSTSQYTPTAITGTTNNPIIAPFWADVDTRGPAGNITPGGTSTGTNLLWYDLDTANHAFTATWDDVGYYSFHVDKLDAFQLRLTAIQAPDGTFNGDFDIEFRYEDMNWTTGDASGGSGGLGGVLAHAGYSSGNGVNYLELPQSGNQAALLALDQASNVGQPGLYQFSVRNGSAVVAASADDASTAEGNGPGTHFVVVPIRLSAASTTEVTIDYTTADGTALAGKDYIFQRGSLTFAPGVTQQNVYVEVIGDTVPEPDETFFVQLSGSTGVSIADSAGLVTIVNDDGITVSNVTKLEGTGAGTTDFAFTVTLLTASTQTVTVDYATKNGTALAGTDYTATSGKLTFAPGETTKTVVVSVAADAAVEPDETFTLQLSNATGAPIVNAAGLGTITNDDGIVVQDVRITEGTGASPTTATVTLRLQTAVATPVTVDWATQPGSAATPGDFTTSSGKATFAAGATTTTITIPVIADALVEGDESFNVVLSNPVGSAIVDGTGVVTIIDDDGFQVSDLAITEGTGGTVNATFTVTLQSALAATSTVKYATRNGTATAGSDYTAASGTLTFGAGVTSQTVSVAIGTDSTPEPNETFFLDLSAPSANAGISRATAQATIANDDGFLVGDASVTEGNAGTFTVNVPVTLSGPAAAAVSVTWATSDGTAIAPGDYKSAGGTLTFAPGETSKTAAITYNGDTLWEPNETFRVVLSNPVNSAIVDASGTVTILNDDTRPPPVVRVSAAAVTEGTLVGNTLHFLVGLDYAATSAVTIDYATADGTAVAGKDYTTTTGTLTIAAGSLFGVIDVPVLPDAVVEPDETLTLTLSNAKGGATIGTASATGTILNDDSTLAITATDTTKLEGHSGSTPFTFTVNRTGDTTQQQGATWTVLSASPSASPANAADFTGGVLPSGTVTFAPGETKKTITVNVAGDTALEGQDQFVVTLTNPTGGATITTDLATGTILNDDNTLAIAATAASKAEGQSGSTPFTFTVTRTGYLGASSVNWAVTGNGATAADFAGGVLPSGVLSFAANETSKTITVNVAGDTAVEANEGFTVTLSGASVGSTITTATAAGTILNDDTSLAIAAAAASKAEGQSGVTPLTFTVTRSGLTTGATSVNWAVTGSGASPAVAADFQGAALPSGVLSFAANETSKTITINVAGDTAVEANETFAVTLSGPTGGATITTAAATGTILNDDTSLAIAAAAASKAEGQSGVTPLTFTVTRSGVTTGATSVNWAVTGSGASPAAAADFTGAALPSGVVAFAAGETSKTITVNVAGDTAVEANETFAVTLSGPTGGATITTAAATGTILNDDTGLAIAAAAASKAEGQSGVTPLTFTVTRSGLTTGATSVNWAVTGSGASPAVAADFQGAALPSGVVAFAAGETSKTITVNVAGDTAVEANETFAVTLSGATGGATITTAAATGTILNDDTGLAIAAAAASKAEGQSGVTPLTFTVTRSGVTTGATSVNWAVTGSGASPAVAADFQGAALPSGVVAFAAGETSKTITVNVAGDIAVEANETFAVTLSGATGGATITTAAATGTILNDDTSLAIAAAAASKAEGQSGATPLTFTVTRSGVTTGATSVNWAVAGSGASPAAAADFQGAALPSGVVTFAAGETSKTITVNVAGDTVVEPNETFAVTLSGATGGATITTASATGTIQNDDTTTPAPGAPDLAAASDSGASNTDNITKATTPVFTGKGATAGATVTLLDGANSVGTATADASGNWSITSKALADGVHTLTAKQTVSGNLSLASPSLTVTIDTAPPAAPGKPDLTTGIDAPVFTGTGPAGTTLSLLDGATVIGSSTVDGTGKWSVAASALKSTGVHTITAKATDTAGNVSTASSSLLVTLGTAGGDLLIGSPGREVLAGLGGDDVYAVDNSDDVVLEKPGDGQDLVAASVNYTLATGSEVESLYANAGPTGLTLTGNGADNTLVGGDGADTLRGAGGADLMIGGDGNDTMEGGAGDDLYVVANSGDIVNESVGQGSDTIIATVGYTLPALSEIEFMIADAGATGVALTGNKFNNLLIGGDGNDTLTGGGGGDGIAGGGGVDTFAFAALTDSQLVTDGLDIIADFAPLIGEKIDLHLLDANANLAGDQAFSFIGTAPLSGVAGQLAALDADGNTMLLGDVNGDGLPDFGVLLLGSQTLGNNNFVL
ncbi:MAG: Calx-beta domain-containing protein [Acetobacteraceae bacterium]